MLSSILHHLRSLGRFSGREPRDLFWPYAGFVFFIDMVAMTLLMIPQMVGSFARMHEFAARNPDKAKIESGPGHYSIQISGHHPELMPDMRLFSFAVGAMAILSVLLLAAAVVRRLHDSGRSGFWGLMPLPFLGFGIVQMPRLMDEAAAGDVGPDSFFLLFFNNLIYLLLLGLLGFLLARRGTAGPNRFGAIPETIANAS